MKTSKSTSVFTVWLIATSFFLLSCGKSGPAPASPQDQVKALLSSGTWKLQSSSVDGVDQTASYNGFTITFTNTGYTTTKGGVIWPSSGTWSFQGTSTTTIARNDKAVVQIQVKSSSLVMAINWATTTLGGGRTTSTKGNNVFTMTH